MIENRTYRYLFFALIILVGLFWVIWGYALPRFLEQRLIPELTRKAGISNLSLHVRKIGLNGADLGSLKIGDAKRPGISIDSIQVDFSPAGLINRSVDRLVLTGLVLRIDSDKSKLTINGVNLSPSSGQPSESLSISEMVSQFPVKVVAIPNAIVYYGETGQLFRLPMSLQVVTVSATSEPISIEFELFPRGQRISGNGKIDPRRNQGILALSTAHMPLGAFSDIITPPGDAVIDAFVDAAATATITLDPFSIDQTKGQFDLMGTCLSSGGIQLRNTKDETGADRPIHIALETVEKQQWAFTISDFTLDSPVVGAIAHSSGQVSLKRTGLEITGKLDTALSTSGKTGDGTKPVFALGDARVGWDFSGGLDSSGSWRLHLESLSQAPSKDAIFNAAIGSWQISSETPQVRIFGEGKGDQWSGTFGMKTRSFTISQGQNRIKIPEFTLRAHSDMSSNLQGPGRVSLTADAPATRILTDSVNIKIPKLALQAALFQADDGGLTSTGKLAFSKVSMTTALHPGRSHR